MNVVITGVSKGIGRAIAEKFAAASHTIIGCARNEIDLYKTMDELVTKYPECSVKVRSVDLSDTKQVKQFGNWIIETGVVPDILVNNAGEFIPGSIYNEEEGTLEKMIGVNLYSAYHLTRTLLPAMTERKQGHIFNICSIASLTAYSNGGSYSISKFAMLGFSKNLREEMKPNGIKVTAICPGATMTSSWEGSDIDPKRIMEVNDVAELIYASTRLSPMAVVEDIIMRPQLGDL
ncbi:MAG: SDR family oxidoreductase [Segetibacter sp.]|nr:SDR family oxidoreductase [Segetibacter sp.]